MALLAYLGLPLVLVGVTAAGLTFAAAPATAQAGACGDKPCGTLPPAASPCGDKPCGTLPAGANPCGDTPCGTLPPGATPCGDKACGTLPAGANPNNRSGSTPSARGPASAGNKGGGATTTTRNDGSQAGQAAQDPNLRNTSSSGSGWLLPVALVALAGLLLLWLFRRHRRRADVTI